MGDETLNRGRPRFFKKRAMKLGSVPDEFYNGIMHISHGYRHSLQAVAGTFGRMGKPRAVLAIALCMLLPACATRPPESEEIRMLDPLGAVSLYDLQRRPVLSTPEVRSKPHINILALSGGGSDGAFGVGVLKGWSDSGKRPEFDIVTGVSTGALIASLAFLGPEYDAVLEEAYTTTTNKDVFLSKGLTGVFGASLYDYAPFKKTIESLITQDVLDAIAREHRNGRRLYVATTNLDAGRLVVWDIGLIASSDHARRLRIVHKILRASAAVPAFFKPVYIQPVADSKARQMHVDGGVKAPVLIRSFMFNTQARKTSLYVIVNGQIRLLNAEEAVEPGVVDISRKAISELLRGLLYESVYHGYVIASNAGADFNLIYIPDKYPATEDALEFDPAAMGRIFEIGYELGRSGKGWRNDPPRLHELSRVR